MNKAIFVGRTTRDGELKVTPSGVNVGEFTLAVERGFGEKKQVDYVRCSLFGKAAESIQSYVKKGDLISVVGEVTCNAWTDKQGETKSQMNVYVAEWKKELSATKKEEKEEKSGIDMDDFETINSSNIPF